MSSRHMWSIALGWLALGGCLCCPVAQGAVALSTLLDDSEINRLERGLLRDGQDGTLDEHDLLTAALIASGVRDEGSLSRYRRQLRLWSTRLNDQTLGQSDPLLRASLVVEFLHAQMFHGEYRAIDSNLRDTIERGDYDCLTAAILFCWLYETIGGQASIQYQPGHVNVRIECSGRPWVIEPTSRTHSPQLSAAKSFAIYDLRNTHIIALLYYNQGVNLLERGDYSVAAVANLKALQLFAGHRDARHNLLAAWNNWAIECYTGGDSIRAAQLLRLVLTVAPESTQARQNLQTIDGSAEVP